MTAPDIYKQLDDATPDEKRDIVLRVIEAHPEARLELPALNGVSANLEGIDLCSSSLQAAFPPEELDAAPWWDNDADRCVLRNADLSGACLEKADLRKVDLSEARLRRANLRGVVLDNADLQNAVLTSANLHEARLRKADLEGASLESAQLQHTTLAGANLYRAQLRKADLHDASLEDGHLREACLENANLRHVALTSANLQRASLRGANLRDTDLTPALIKHIYVGNAWLDKTRLYWEQIEGRIGEELEAAGKFGRQEEGNRTEEAEDRASAYKNRASAYREARRAYLALKRNFADMGDHHARTKAYLKERRMEKRETYYQALADLSERRIISAANKFVQVLLDLIAELTCDYGVSIPRVVASLGAVYLAFIAAYAFTGSVLYDPPLANNPEALPKLRDLARLSLGAMTTLGADGLKVQRGPMEFLAGLEAFLGIGLTGLLGFVLGNRIRRL